MTHPEEDPIQAWLESHQWTLVYIGVVVTLTLLTNIAILLINLID